MKGYSLDIFSHTCNKDMGILCVNLVPVSFLMAIHHLPMYYLLVQHELAISQNSQH